MKVLIACEFSGIVRDAFRARGHDAISCDLLPTEREGPHVIGDVGALLSDDWDLIIAHPPCTDLCASGARWWKDKGDRQADAVAFVRRFLEAPCPRVAVENPIGALSRLVRKPDQIVHPWWFGDPESKATCWWLRGLAPLEATNPVQRSEVKASTWRAPDSKGRWKKRSRTFRGMAEAMAAQWG